MQMASLRTLSPKTREYNNGSQFNLGLPKIERVATGSTDDINAPNISDSSGPEVSMGTKPTRPMT